MKGKRKFKRRKSRRYPDYDYTLPGGYFITICTYNRMKLMVETAIQEMIMTWWDRLPEKFPGVILDEFVVMPDHVHGILFIEDPLSGMTGGVNPRVQPVGRQTHGSASDKERLITELDRRMNPNLRLILRHSHDGIIVVKKYKVIVKPSLSRIIQWFKTMTTNAYISGVRHNGWKQFNKRFWQSNYHDRIIRSESELQRIRAYIKANPIHWKDE